MFFYIKKINYVFLATIIFALSFGSFNYFLTNSKSVLIDSSPNEFVLTGGPQIINTSYEYDYTTGTGILEAYYFIGYDQFGIHNIPGHLALTTNPETPSNGAHVQWEFMEGVLSEEYTTSLNWSSGRTSSIITDTPELMYHSTVELINIPEDFKWEEYYVITHVYSTNGSYYSEYDAVPVNYSIMYGPEARSTSITDMSESTVTMKSEIYAGDDIDGNPWVVDETSIVFRDYDSVEILSTSMNGDIFMVEYKISDLSPETFYKTSSFTVSFTETVYTGAVRTVTQIIPSFTTESLPIIVSPEEDSTLNMELIYIITVVLAILFLIIVLAIVSLIYRGQKKKRNLNN